MTNQQPSQNKQILDKVNEALAAVKDVSTQVGGMSNQISAIEAELKLRPTLDKSEHDSIRQEVSQHKESITKLENNQRWVVLAILASVIVSVMQLVAK